MAKKVHEKVFDIFSTREIHVKILMRYDYTRIAKMKNVDDTKCWCGCGATRTPMYPLWEFKWKN